MSDRNLGRRRLPETLEDGSSTWAWIAGGVSLAFVLALVFVLSTGDRVQMASHSPPAIDPMVTPPITQPAR
jgi:hypothetical protein